MKSIIERQLNLLTESSDQEDHEQLFSEWFLALPGRAEVYLKIPESFLEDDFNLCGLDEKISVFDDSLAIILNGQAPTEEELADELISSGIVNLYELIHQRYLVSRHGLHEMYGRWIHGAYGNCPRALCNGEHMLPHGASLEIGQANVALYCPRCQDTYTPASKKVARLDGCGFGPNAAHLLLLHYHSNLPRYVPPMLYERRIFGFRLASDSKHHTKLKNSFSKRLSQAYRYC